MVGKLVEMADSRPRPKPEGSVEMVSSPLVEIRNEVERFVNRPIRIF